MGGLETLFGYRRSGDGRVWKSQCVQCVSVVGLADFACIFVPRKIHPDVEIVFLDLLNLRVALLGFDLVTRSMAGSDFFSVSFFAVVFYSVVSAFSATFSVFVAAVFIEVISTFV